MPATLCGLAFFVEGLAEAEVEAEVEGVLEAVWLLLLPVTGVGRH